MRGNALTMLLSAAAIMSGSGAALAQDAAAGERLFSQCRTCHQVGPTARIGVGPPLNGLFDGRKKGTWPGHSYSAAYQGFTDVVWNEDLFRTYIKDPRGVTPGTKMAYLGMKDDAQIDNLIAHLKQFAPDGTRRP